MARASGWTILSKLAKLISLIAVAGVLAAGFLIPYIGGAGLLATKAADKFNNTACTLQVDTVQQTTTMYASDGTTPIASFFDQNRSVIPFAQMPKSVINALVSTEDRRFYEHHGVDLKGLIRAALHTSNGNTQGGSTLTEQYVKQVNYYSAISKGNAAAAQAAIDQNVDRKISDAKCALELEKKYTKDQILEKYLNIAYFGENSYGIDRAAAVYFGIHASQLSIAQAAMIAGLVKAPSDYDPFTDIAAARARRDLVLTNMFEQNYISAAEEATAKASPIKLVRQSQPQRGCAYYNTKILNAGFFCDYAYDWLISTGGLTAEQIATGGLKIVTTLQVGLQNQGQKAIASSGLDPANPYLLAMPSVQPQNGGVTSMITDKHYGATNPKGQKDPAYTVGHLFTDAYAGSGSTYKYFTALAALKAGVSPDFTLTANSPYTMKNCTDPTNLAYHPQNAGTYNPTLPLKLALPESSNTYFVAMEDQLFGCNVAPAVNTATGLGLTALLQKQSSGKTRAQEIIQGQSTTFTLGQEATSSLQLTGAFAALANDGVFCPPHPIQSITDSAGKKVAFKQVTCSRQFDSYVARTLVNIMVQDTNSSNGTAGSFFNQAGGWYANGGSAVAAKTGTNNSSDKAGNDNGGNSALWFVGITPNLTSAAALVNPQDPNLQIDNVPGVTGQYSGDTFGAYASKFWLASYSPSLAHQHWTWPTVDSTPGNPVPGYLAGEDVASATTALQQAGFRANVLKDQTCGSKYAAGTVAYYGPLKAMPNAVISLCLSSGVAPVATPTKKPTTSATKPTTPATTPRGQFTQPSTTPTPKVTPTKPKPSTSKTKTP